MCGDRFIKITSADDQRIVEFCNIKERDLTRHADQFIAEGKVVLQHLINSQNSDHRFEILKILILENRLEGVQDLLNTVVRDVPIYIADKSVMNEIAGFEMHRGILALGRYHASVAIDACDKQSSLVLAACGISNHDNLGSIFRNAAAFGVDKIILDETCCHPLYRKAVRVSVGSALTVPFELNVDVFQLISDYNEKGYSIYGLSPHGTEMLDDIKPTQKTLLLLGTEGEGLPASVLSQVRTVKIAQSNALDSLNVATASGIALWQIARKMALI